MSETEANTTLAVTIIRNACRLGRFLIFLGTAGWACPHTCTEGMDLTRIQNEHMAGRRTQAD